MRTVRRPERKGAPAAQDAQRLHTYAETDEYGSVIGIVRGHGRAHRPGAVLIPKPEDCDNLLREPRRFRVEKTKYKSEGHVIGEAKAKHRARFSVDEPRFLCDGVDSSFVFLGPLPEGQQSGLIKVNGVVLEVPREKGTNRCELLEIGPSVDPGLWIVQMIDPYIYVSTEQITINGIAATEIAVEARGRVYDPRKQHEDYVREIERRGQRKRT